MANSVTQIFLNLSFKQAAICVMANDTKNESGYYSTIVTLGVVVDPSPTVRLMNLDVTLQGQMNRQGRSVEKPADKSRAERRCWLSEFAKSGYCAL